MRQGKKLISENIKKINKDYGFLLTKGAMAALAPKVSAVRLRDLEAIRTLLDAIGFIDQEVQDVLNLTSAVVEDAREFEQVIMSSSEGTELIELLKVRHPDFMRKRGARRGMHWT